MQNQQTVFTVTLPTLLPSHHFLFVMNTICALSTLEGKKKQQQSSRPITKRAAIIVANVMRKPFPIKHALVWESGTLFFSTRWSLRDARTVSSTFFARNRISYSRDNCLHSERWSPTAEADTHTAGGRWTYCTNTRSSPRTASPPRLENGWTAQEMQQGSR